MSTINGMPGAIVIVDSKKEWMLVDEAKRVNVPIVALCNTDCDINAIEYPIVCNDAAPGVVREMLENIKKAIA
jgi:small subunit ribosomal protein S2